MERKSSPLDMSKADDKTPGILILELEGETPDREVKIIQAELLVPHG
jgi:hypothetical protein